MKTEYFINRIEARRGTHWWIAAALLALAVKLWLVGAHALMATTTPHDDLLFVSQAHAILGGDWLGSYDQLTLIKGPFYPIFIVIGYYLNLPLLTAQQLLYAVAVSAAVLAVAPVVRSRWLLFLVFVLLLFNPFSFNYPAIGRVFRLGIYMSLGMLVFSCFLGLAVRTVRPGTAAVLWSLGAAISLAAFWNTREESIWIVPGLFILSLPALWRSVRPPRRRALLVLALYVLPVAVLFGFNNTLKSVNERFYGVPATIELRTPEFKSAYGGLLRIRSGAWRQYFPVVRQARQQAYEVSPAFAELEPYLDGSIGAKWQNLCGCYDLPAAFFIWALRDSVAAAGYYENGPETLDFYRRIGTEIDAACADGRLDCRARISSLVPPWHREYNAQLGPTAASILSKMIGFTEFSAATEGLASQGRAGIMLMYEVVTRERLLPSRGSPPMPAYHLHFDKEKTRILDDIGGFYQIAVPLLFGLALAIFIYRAGRSLMTRTWSIFTVAAFAALAGMLALTFILTLLAITSYSEIERALHASYPMVLLFIVSVLLDISGGIGSGDQVDDNGGVNGQWR